jgi:hypothetical protein
MRVCDKFTFSLHIYFIDNYVKEDEHMARRKKNLDDIEQVDYYEEVEDGFSEGDVITGTVLSSFSFAPESAEGGGPDLIKPLEFIPVTAAAQKKEPGAPKAFEFNSGKASVESLLDTRKTKTEGNVATPTVDGEAYTVGRYYKLRYSTAKMLNEIKAGHKDVNVYMNSIVDEAIRWYYGHLFGEGKGYR